LKPFLFTHEDKTLALFVSQEGETSLYEYDSANVYFKKLYTFNMKVNQS
jgi:hypothetical protein